MINSFFLAVFMLAPALRAERFPMDGFRAGESSYSIELGYSRPSAPDFRESTRPGASVSLQYLRYSWDWIAFGFELGHQRFLAKKNPSRIPLQKTPAAVSSAELNASHATVLTRVNFFESGTWTPYALGGAGWHRTELTLQKGTGLTATKQVETGSGLLVTAGAGIEAFVLRDFSVSAEGRFRELRLNPRAFTSHSQNLNVSIGLHFWFGRRWRMD